MKNFIQPGNSIDVQAPSAVSSGDGVLVGAALFGVAVTDAENGADVTIEVEGVFELPKLSADVMAVGALVNWNNSNKEMQILTSTLDGAAIVLEAAGNGILVVKVKLVP